MAFRPDFSLDGKAALVIGASNPLGRAIAVALAEAGANVGVSTTTCSKKGEVAANSCANEIWALNRKGFAQAIDAGDEADVEGLVERAASGVWVSRYPRERAGPEVCTAADRDLDR